MAKEKILIVEDEEEIRELINYNLIKSGFDTIQSDSGEEGLKKFVKYSPDLILLDLMLPGMDGLEFLRAIKNNAKNSPCQIIIVTAKGEEEDIVKGLELGADDYITKPFSPKILISRIRTVLRRKSKQTPDANDILKISDIVIHPGRHEVTINTTPIDLTFTEFKILHFLASRPGWVFTRYQIVDAIRGEEYPVTDRAVDVQIVGLRKKMGTYGELIETVRGIGYRFKE